MCFFKKYQVKKILLLSLITVLSITVLQAEQPKRDVRAVWLTTVWSLDWPNSGQTPAQQQNALINIINKLDDANFNTIYFQVRTMCDALYKSKFPEEPWSQWLTGTRGQDPGWDPLTFIVAEAHKRGIEVHAWLNPYRYSSASGTHGTLPTDYVNTKPGWLLDYGGLSKILNPGVPEVRTRIADVVEDIITNYNVDGIIFDDYFYQNNTTDAMDQAQFDAYPNGFPNTSAGRHDWRRENVNMMVAEVYERINSLKPWLPFGISPAGVAMGSNIPASVREAHGITEPSPGSDWQYSSIYSDPVMWIRRNTIDYISPQVYWAIGSGAATDYSTIIPWWARLCNRHGRYLFSSNTSTNMGSNLPAQIVAQVGVNRDADLNGVTGSVLFRANSYSQAAYNALKADPNRYLALTANYGWKQAPVQGLVQNLNISGQNLTWNYTSTDARTDVRYAIYAVPLANIGDADVFSSPKYLRGVSYTTSFALPAGVSTATHQIAVAVYDRFGNIFPPRTVNGTLSTVVQAQLTYPANNATDVVIPSIFTWEANGAHKYVWQLSHDADFTNPVASREVTSPAFNIGLQANMQGGISYYWRVISMRADAEPSVSEVYSFTGIAFQVLTPGNNETNVSITPEISWLSLGSGAAYTLELSTNTGFTDIVYTVQTSGTSVEIPTPLRIGTPYFARVHGNLGTINTTSVHTRFTTDLMLGQIPVPTILSPATGDEIVGNSITITWEGQIARGFRVQISQNPSFPNMNSQTQDVSQNATEATFANLVAGTWHIRMRAETVTETGISNTAWTPTVTVETGKTSLPKINVNRIPVAFYTIMGIRLGQEPQSGIFIIRYDDGSVERVMK
jgi:uncharacterized lipoprotein YddW (UPF0748 family)